VEWADRVEPLLADRPRLVVDLAHASCGRTAVVHWEDEERFSSLAASGDTP
jgi:hypothetical protein